MDNLDSKMQDPILSDSASQEETRSAELVNGTLLTSQPSKYQKVTIDLSVSKPQRKKALNTLMVVAADRSGSMAGSAWRQVQDSLQYMIENSLNVTTLDLKIITYNHSAELLQCNALDYKSKIAQLLATGATYFANAFVEIERVISEYGKLAENIVVVFMTDGDDTSGVVTGHGVASPQLATQQQQFQTFLCSQKVQTTVHSIGFTKDHKYDFLNALRKFGTQEGVFRFADPMDGLDKLKTKFIEVFDFVASGETRIQAKVVLPKGVAFVETTDGTLEVELQGDPTTPTPYSGRLEFWTVAEVLPDQPIVQVTVKNASTLAIPLITKEVESKFEQSMWNVEILAIEVADLNKRMVEAHEAKRPLKTFADELQAIQTKLYGTNPLALPKMEREAFFENRAEIQKNIDLLHALLADDARGSTNVSTIAKANDIRFTGQFKKQRHQRVLDMRIAKNTTEFEALEQELKKLQLVHVEDLSEDAKEFFYCMLSSLNIEELMSDPNSCTDIMGFGLAVVRPEFAIDEATTLRIDTISNTLVTQSALQSAIKYKLDVQNKLDAHGGFETNELGFAVTGGSREPINSFLPLYIHAEHWKRVKLLLKPALAYLVTLDPLGFAPNQMDLPFMILGSMITRLPKRPSDQQLNLLFSLYRTCYQIRLDFDLANTMDTKLSSFISTAGSRTKDKIPNLLTILGWLLCTDKPPTKEEFYAFKIAFLQEHLRRACRVPFKDTNDAVILGLVDLIIHGENENANMTLEEALGLMSDPNYQPVDNSTLDDVAFDPTKNLIEPSIEQPTPTQQSKEDKKMEELGKYHLGGLSQNKTKQYSQKLQAEKGAVLKKEMPKPTPYNPDCVGDSTIKALKRLETQILKNCLPPLASICNAFHFIEKWFDMQISPQIIDKNGSMPPSDWLEAIKKDCTVRFVDNVNIAGTFQESGIAIDFNGLRTAVLQAVYYVSNATASTAANQGRYVDPVHDHMKLLTWFHDYIDQRIQNARETIQILAEGKRVVMYALNTKDIIAFVGYMVRLFSENDRNEVFKIMCGLIQNSQKGQIPDIVEKMKILLTGRYKSYPVIGRGNSWLPESTTKEKFQLAIGVDDYLQAELAVRGTYTLHIYRPSDLPNRHGHCNR